MSDYLLAAVDGTGSADWRRADGSNSHIHKFFRDFAAVPKAYWDGPDTLGTRCNEIRDSVVRWILAKSGLNPLFPACLASPPKICLVGHSRGAMITIAVARALKQHDLPVRFLGLYDAVDMSLEMGGSSIVNVETTYHAIRSPVMGSRSSWGNTGRTSEGVYVERAFLTSHGGIGGDAVLTAEGLSGDYSCDITTLRARISLTLGQDRGELCQRESRAADVWIRQAARRAGMPVRQGSSTPATLPPAAAAKPAASGFPRGSNPLSVGRIPGRPGI